jgi:hypothetical protein
VLRDRGAGLLGKRGRVGDERDAFAVEEGENAVDGGAFVPLAAFGPSMATAEVWIEVRRFVSRRNVFTDQNGSLPRLRATKRTMPTMIEESAAASRTSRRSTRRRWASSADITRIGSRMTDDCMCMNTPNASSITT